MNEQRLQAYYQLIQQLLSCPHGEEAAILQANRELLDVGFLQMVVGVAGMFTQQGEENTANWLLALASQLSEELDIPLDGNTPEPETPVNQADILRFLVDVLIVTGESEGNPQVVYPLLEANKDKLNLTFVKLFQGFATKLLKNAEAEPARAENTAIDILNFSNLIQQFPLGKPANNLEIAITGYKIALTLFTRDTSPEKWATIKNNLGAVYRKRIGIDKAQNLEDAIAAYKQALEVRTPTNFPEQWATTQNNLGNAYCERIWGDKAQNLEDAIAAYKKALEVRTYTDFPEQWAMTQNNLGNAYSERIWGDKAQNLEDAITAYNQALDFYTQALKVYTRTDFPEQWAMTKNTLGNAYNNRIRGDKAENLEIAIAAYNKALEVYTPADFPEQWAMTKNNLGAAYNNRIRGDKAENLENAIAAYNQALEVYTRTDFPEKWAGTQNNLGLAYSNRIKEDKAQNLEDAIAAYNQALEVYTRTDFPVNWAMTQNNLGNAYRKGIRGDKAQNLEDAIAAYQQALKVYTRTDFPVGNAGTLLNLGILYQGSQQFDLAYDTFESAIITVENLRGEIISGEESKRKQAEEWNHLFSRMVEVCLALGKETEAITYIERSKTRNLVEQILNRDLKTIFPGEVVTQLEQLRDEIASGQNLLQTGKYEDEDPTFLWQYLHQLRQQRQQLQDTHLSIGSSFDFASLEKIVDNNTAIIEWYIDIASIASNKILAFVIQPGGKKIKIWQSKSEDGEALIDWLNGYFSDYDEYKEKQTSQKWQNQLEERLNNLSLILHIEEILEKIPPQCQKLILIPHVLLHLLPLHALPAKNSYLMDLFPQGVGYAPSCQLLQQVQLRQCNDFQSLFAMQTPTEDLYEKDLGAVAAIKKQFNQSYVLKKDKAKKSEIIPVTENLIQANNLFFFCHGYFNFNSPLDSGLKLADETLTLADIITNIKLENCRLVTLAACETGMIDMTSIGDEYIGLPSGFLLAGSTNVVSSLWSVNATATALLMVKFYKELKHQKNIVLALQNSQRWLRETNITGFKQWVKESSLSFASQNQIIKYFDIMEQKNSENYQPFSSPVYWSAFCCIGKGV
ncbi:MAG: CHAT domain-containing protein [Dolichospermum sp. JUN01]|nr:CHAT domain-containing protein [Dolichospermum sp. JUN01]